MRIREEHMIFNPRIGIPYRNLVGREVILYDSDTNEDFAEGVVTGVELIEDPANSSKVMSQEVRLKNGEYMYFHGSYPRYIDKKLIVYRLKILDGDGVDVQTAKEKKLDTIAESVYNLLSFKMNCKEIEKVLNKVRKINDERANGK